MRLTNENAELYTPSGAPPDTALRHTTHMAIAAHQDDIEIMAFHGIKECYRQSDKHFTAVVATDGAGSARSGKYAEFTDDDMKKIRRTEQKTAADIGEYNALVLLDYASKEIKDAQDGRFEADLTWIFSLARPEVIYTHNLADKHDSHLAVAVKTIQALRILPQARRPKKVYGCEVWRGLDWLPDEDKTVLDVSGYDELSAALLGAFDSQIAGGKRYDLATEGRRLANATYYASHGVDNAQKLSFALDLTPLINSTTDPADFIAAYLDRLKADVLSRLTKLAQ
jgi:LmbE family N-acetylglucosaminyl deacetylase